MATAPYHKPAPLGRSARTVPRASGSYFNWCPSRVPNGGPGATACLRPHQRTHPVLLVLSPLPGPRMTLRPTVGLGWPRNRLSGIHLADNDVATHASTYNAGGPVTPSQRWSLHVFGTNSPSVAARFPRAGFRSCRERHPFANRQVSATNEPGPHDPALA